MGGLRSSLCPVYQAWHPGSGMSQPVGKDTFFFVVVVISSFHQLLALLVGYRPIGLWMPLVLGDRGWAG